MQKVIFYFSKSIDGQLDMDQLTHQHERHDPLYLIHYYHPEQHQHT